MPAATEAGPELESYMSRHLTLRFAVLTAVTAGALFTPATAALADNPTPATTTTSGPSDAAKKRAEAAKEAEATKAPEQKEAAVAEARKAEDAKRMPRGGVAAGEAVAGDSATGTAALAGSAAGALLLAGAGTFVVRRRSAARREG
jgi:hypothetical protein